METLELENPAFISQDTADAIAVLPSLPDADKDRQASAIVGRLWPWIRTASVGWCRRNGDPNLVWREDLEADVAVELIVWLRDYARDPNRTTVREWGPYLNVVASAMAGALFGREPYAPVGGMAGLNRRRKEAVASLRIYQRTYSTLPTAAELAAFHNALIRKRRKNPEKQGALLSIDEARGILG